MSRSCDGKIYRSARKLLEAAVGLSLGGDERVVPQLHADIACPTGHDVAGNGEKALKARGIRHKVPSGRGKAWLRQRFLVNKNLFAYRVSCRRIGMGWIR